MLVLTRKTGETILIGNITVTVAEINETAMKDLTVEVTLAIIASFGIAMILAIST